MVFIKLPGVIIDGSLVVPQSIAKTSHTQTSVRMLQLLNCASTIINMFFSIMSINQLFKIMNSLKLLSTVIKSIIYKAAQMYLIYR